MKTAQELISWCESKLGCGYVFGCNGYVLTEALLKTFASRYPKQYTASYIERTRKWLGKESYDCSGLIDVFLGIDYSAAGYYSRSTKKGKIVSYSDMPNVPGLLVFRMDASGHVYHIGVHIGNNVVIDARGVDYGVVKRERTSIWTHWGYCNLIDYGNEVTNTMLLKIGSKGDDVKLLQEHLNKIGGYGLVADGIFGSKTESAVKDFQSKSGLIADGIVGDKTWAEIIEQVTPAPEPEPDYKALFLAESAKVDSLKTEVATLTGINDAYYKKLIEVGRAFDVLENISIEF